MAYDENVPSDEPSDSSEVYGPSTVIAALEQIEARVEEARSVPLSASVMVNRAEILDLIEQARAALPEDLVAADALVADADAVLGRADSAAEMTLTEARTQARTLTDEAREQAEHMIAEAQDKAQRTVAHAQEQAEHVANQARSDAENTLSDANAQAERLIASDRISQMAEDRARQLVGEAKNDARKLREGADRYVVKSLGELSDVLSDLHRRAQAGQRTILERASQEKTDISLDDE